MTALFYISSAVAIIATLMAITRLNPVHALLYLVVSLLAVALIFFSFGAPFVAALEVIIYAGAIMILFLFAIMMLHIDVQTAEEEKQRLGFTAWIIPVLLSLVLLAEVVYILTQGAGRTYALQVISPKQVGVVLFGPYLIGVELASLILLAGLIGAYHLGRRVSGREGES